MEHEGYLIKTAHDSKLPADAPSDQKMSLKEARSLAQKDLNKRLGAHATRDKALELGISLDSLGLKSKPDFTDDATVQALENYKDIYFKTPALVLQYFDGYDSNYVSLCSNIIGRKFQNLIEMMSNCALAQDPFTQEKPAAPGAKPNPANYAQGANDPEFQAALNVWLPKKEEQMKYSADTFNYTAEKNMQAIDEIASRCPPLAPVCNVMRALRDSYRTFIETKNVEDVKKAMSAYEALDDVYQITSKAKVKAYSYYWYVDSKYDYSYNNLSFNQLYGVCEETGGVAFVDEFIAYIAQVSLDTVTNETVAEAKTMYASIPHAMKPTVPAETMEKYWKILALYKPVLPLEPSGDRFEDEIAAFRPTQIAAPQGMEKADVQELLSALEKLLPEVLNEIPAISAMGGMEALMEQGVYTNAALTGILTLYNTIENANINIDAMGMNLNISSLLGDMTAPQKLSAFLNEETFAGAKAKIDAAAKNGAGTTADYLGIAFENGDWGFEDGSRDGFAKAMAACLRPITDLLCNGMGFIGQIIVLPNSVNDDGDYIYGAYEYLIPLLEGLGLENILSSQEYTKQLQDASKISSNAQLDALILPILQPVLGMMENLAEAPIHGLLTLLPNLAKLVNDNTLSTCLTKALGTSPLITGVTVDLSGDALNTMLSGLLSNLVIDETTTLNLAFSPIDWAALAGCGQAVLKDSAKASNQYRVAVEADTADTFLLIYRYAFENLIGNSGNRQQISNLLAKQMPENAMMITQLLNMASSMGADGVLELLMSALVSPEEPVPPTTNPEPTPNPEEPQPPVGAGPIPQTGDALLITMSAAALLGVGFYLTARKKRG